MGFIICDEMGLILQFIGLVLAVAALGIGIAALVSGTSAALAIAFLVCGMALVKIGRKINSSNPDDESEMDK